MTTESTNQATGTTQHEQLEQALRTAIDLADSLIEAVIEVVNVARADSPEPAERVASVVGWDGSGAEVVVFDDEVQDWLAGIPTTPVPADVLRGVPAWKAAS